MTGSEVNHFEIRERFGLPTEQVGSVNDPRTREEHGVRWNEKWIYDLPNGARRIVYWYRYDFRGLLREEADGSVRQEAL